jgi:hypothetical protein
MVSSSVLSWATHALIFPVNYPLNDEHKKPHGIGRAGKGMLGAGRAQKQLFRGSGASSNVSLAASSPGVGA